MRWKLDINMFLGIFFVLWGSSLLINTFFDFNIPFWPLFWGFLFIYIGTVLLIGPVPVWHYKKKYYTFTIHPEDNDPH